MRILDVLLEMRRYRTGLIQTADQLRFSYLAVIEGAKYIKGDTSVQASLFFLLCVLHVKGTNCTNSQLCGFYLASINYYVN